jgi:hypothetical protein
MRLGILVAITLAACSPTVYVHGAPNLYAVDGDYLTGSRSLARSRQCPALRRQS